MGIELNLWSPQLEHAATLADFESCELTLRHNAIGQAVVKLPATSWRAPHLIARGARLTADIDVPGGQRRIFSGRLIEATGDFQQEDPGWSATFESDLSLLWGMLCYPDPTHPASDQSLQQYDTQTGAVETVFKHYVTANMSRFQAPYLPPITVAPTAGRGGNVAQPVKARMHSVGELMATIADAAGLGLWVVQRDSDLLVDVYQTGNHPWELSELGGTLTGWKLTVEAPTATRVLEAGSGSGTARSFLEVAPQYDQQAAWGRRIEVYEEAGGSTQADMQKAATDKLTEAAPKWGVSATIAEGPTFRIGDNVWLGDQVTIDLAAVDTQTEPLREVVIACDQGVDGDGFPAFSVKPAVGETSNGTTRLYQKVTRITDAMKKRD